MTCKFSINIASPLRPTRKNKKLAKLSFFVKNVLKITFIPDYQCAQIGQNLKVFGTILKRLFSILNFSLILLDKKLHLRQIFIGLNGKIL